MASILMPYTFFDLKILCSVAKGCPRLEHIYLSLATSDDHLFAELIALSSLRCLRSIFIRMDVFDEIMPTSEEGEDFRVSLDAIVGQGLLEVNNISFIKN